MDEELIDIIDTESPDVVDPEVPTEPEEPDIPEPPKDSILNTVKKMIGLDKDYHAFDTDLIIHINSVFMILNQLGVGDDKVFTIEDETSTWSDFFDGSEENPALTKSYMYLKVRLLFDPPNTGVLHEAMERQIKEFEWRLNIQVDPPLKEEKEVELDGSRYSGDPDYCKWDDPAYWE